MKPLAPSEPTRVSTNTPDRQAAIQLAQLWANYESERHPDIPIPATVLARAFLDVLDEQKHKPKPIRIDEWTIRRKCRFCGRSIQRRGFWRRWKHVPVETQAWRVEKTLAQIGAKE